MFITPFYRQKCLGTTGHEMPDKSHCVSNHTQLERLFNTCCCSILANIKTSHHWRGIHGSSVDSPHKGPIMRNASSWNRPYSYLQLPMLTRQHVPRFTKLHPWTLLDMAMRPKKNHYNLKDMYDCVCKCEIKSIHGFILTKYGKEYSFVHLRCWWIDWK